MAPLLLEQLRHRANHRCEYCGLPEAASHFKHVADHVIARQHGGEGVFENLALACLRCNQFKGPNIAGLDPLDGTLTRLFNPRTDRWPDHFRWDGPVVVGLTPVGRATVHVLAINLPLRVSVRRSLIREGVYF